MKNLVLIGMPGAGKSTAGVILAKTLRMNFLDVDLQIQERSGRHLQELIDTEGPAGFLAIEEKTLLSLHVKNTVIATGGSVVLSAGAMAHLRMNGVIVYLAIPFAEMEKRLRNITTRGIVLRPGETLREMYDERIPLYEQYAEITVDCTDGHFEECIGRVLGELDRSRGSDR